MKGANIFNTVMQAAVGSNVFNLGHDVKTSFNMGELVPTMLIDTLPGDKFEIDIQNMLRFAPLVSPVMHQVNVTTHVYFVPNRIIWSGWEGFITDTEVTPPTPPYCNLVDQLAVGDLGDYMGLPIGVTESTLRVSALPFAAYAKIYDEFYRDQNIQTTELYTDVVAGRNTAYETIMLAVPKKRAWMHDYFTSCLPTAQAGSTVDLPLLQTDKVDVTAKVSFGREGVYRKVSDNTLTGSGDVVAVGAGTQAVNAINSYYDPDGTLEVDINSNATDINTLRRAFRLQEWLEKSIRGGRRYIEHILSHFGVKSSDGRLDRPEYIGGIKSRMVISEVLSTAETREFDSDTIISPIGNLSGHGISVGEGKKIRFKCEEHGYIMAITNVQPVTGYQDGVERQWSRTDKLDYAWPSFANIGEQEVLDKEIYAKVSIAAGETTFGYVPRYSEYKYMNGKSTGKFRTDLSHWHLNRAFTSAPSLNSSFIECDPDTRIFADETAGAHHIYAHIYNQVKASRKLPKYGIPSI